MDLSVLTLHFWQDNHNGDRRLAHMEIRDPVHGSIYYSDPEVAVLDTAEYQRLRAVKKLGFSEFCVPGATHKRYVK
jgi:HD superfamily phosphohydrolase